MQIGRIKRILEVEPLILPVPLHRETVEPVETNPIETEPVHSPVPSQTPSPVIVPSVPAPSRDPVPVG